MADSVYSHQLMCTGAVCESDLELEVLFRLDSMLFSVLSCEGKAFLPANGEGRTNWSEWRQGQ